METNNEKLSPRDIAMQTYSNARSNLILMIVLTIVNVILYLTGSDAMLLFSATVPYLSAIVALEFNEMFVLFTPIAVGTIVLYLLCWIFSKKRYGWMIFALILFVIDTLLMVGLYLVGEDVSGIVDAIFHIWILYYLVKGVICGYKLKKLPIEEQKEDLSEELIEDSKSVK